MKSMFKKIGMAGLPILLAACDGASWQAGNSFGNKSYKTMIVATGDLTLNTEFAATLSGCQTVEIRPQVSGTITEIHVDEGAEVRKGQALFTIDQVPYKAALKTSEANVKRAKASVSTARLTVDSKRELYKGHVISEFDLQTAENALAEAEAALAEAEAQYISASNDLSYTVVKSPVTGVIGMIPYRVGALVGSSITIPLCTVSDDEEVYAYFSMSEKEMLAYVRGSGMADGYMEQMQPVGLLLADGMPYVHTGKIDAVSGNVDRSTGAIAIRATFPNPERVLRNGGNGTVVVSYLKSDVRVIPQEATFEIQDKIFVYKVVEGKARVTEIGVFPVNNGKEYVVESGLFVGDTIIAEGAGLVKEGVTVGMSNSEMEE